jgi:multimeric flavodoxin WrbA
MNILMINGSPNGAKGNTQILVDEFLAGAIEAGGKAESVFLHKKRIEHCEGCYTCWFNTPGRCVHGDDMAELIEKVERADCVILATPLYVFTVTGYMKDFMDRLLPSAQPFMEAGNGVSRHPRREGRKTVQSMVLISNCGFPESEHFSGMKETVRCWIRAGARELAGMICCAGGPVLAVEEARPMVQWYLDGTRQAGRELVINGRVSQATQALLDRPLVPDSEMYRNTVNERFRSLVR